MNNVLSTCIQRVGTLYLSRLLRFSDRVKDKYLRAFALKGDGKILEIGCGPGTLLGAAPVVSES